MTHAPRPAAADSRPAPGGGNAPRLWALIPCAGVGSRAGTALPKQYQVLAGQPLVFHTLAAFAGVDRLSGTLVVVAPQDGFFAQQPWRPALDFAVATCGGSTRAETVAQGLQALAAQGAGPADWVLVHDAARCLVTAEWIDRLIDACLEDPVGGLLALPLADTLKYARDARVAATPDRARHWLAQTPQMFRLGALSDALRSAGPAVTDESSAMEAAGHAPRLVQGSATNFKVTYPEDFLLAQAVLRSRARSAATDAYDYP